MCEKIKEACGVFGIYNSDNLNAVRETYMALYALQHRGQQSCGIAVNHNGTIISHRDLGLVPDVFNEVVLNHLGHEPGIMALGHVLYSRNKQVSRDEAQPIVLRYKKGNFSIAINGALVNSSSLRTELEENGAIFQSGSDVEIIAHIISRERLKTSSIDSALSNTMKRLNGAYSIILMSPKKLIACRDPHGFRPLCIGLLDNSYVIASETCALDSLGAKFVRDIEPGEIVAVEYGVLRSIKDNCTGDSHLCCFEFVYFARPDSVINNASVHFARQEAGKFLAKRYPVEADIVIGVPDSGLDAALGYSLESGIPYGIGYIKNRYIGRTFIQATQGQREASVKIKLNALSHAVKGKRVVVVDDSIVRGTTTKLSINQLYESGASEVHMRISSPPFINPCYFGTDIDSRDKLIACRMSIDDIRKELGAKTLGYLDIEDLKKIAVGCTSNFCLGCFTGKYPVDISDIETV